MDKTGEYEVIKDSIASNNNFNSATIKQLRTELVSELEPENNAALHGNETIPSDTLRKYISITRDIRAFWFDNVDTHLLTIEHLSDQILARRKAYANARKDTTKTGISNVVSTAASGKAVQDKPSSNKTADVLASMSKLDPAELAKILAALK